jgi:hypothetical protein
MAKPTNRDSDKFMLRLPDGMRDRIKEEADLAGRSMNAEIVLALSFHLDAADHDRDYKAAQAAWDADGRAALEVYPDIDLGQLPATKNDIDRILRLIEALDGKKYT